eukprot:TRINITY_DN6562_c0_g1_i1.p1 TRINITY_DN6562_c0_g1~~TRINITY_DN6562_c0_g1_i1.p1  ORF type:complete len:181 (+),score=19.18 TRINITY_DN6562_c0_g1_i1:144-686(+)
MRVPSQSSRCIGVGGIALWVVLTTIILLVAVVCTQPSYMPPPLTRLSITNALGDHMVLQRNSTDTSIWGWSSPRSSIIVSLSSTTESPVGPVSIADAYTGEWVAKLPSTAAGGPYTTTVLSKSPNGTMETAVMEDIYFGDVFLCGGQSNMVFTVDIGFNGTLAMQAANNYPLIPCSRRPL